MEGPLITNEQEPEPPAYREDASIPLGEVKQVEWAQKGMDVTVSRVVREVDEIIHEDTFFSRYMPWQAIYLVGTGSSGGSAAAP